MEAETDPSLRGGHVEHARASSLALLSRIQKQLKMLQTSFMAAQHSVSTGVIVPTLICDAGWLPAPPLRPRARPVLLQNGTSRRPTRTDHMREQRPRCVIERRFVVRQCSVAALVGWSQFIRILWWPSQASVSLGVARWQCSTDASSMKSL